MNITSNLLGRVSAVIALAATALMLVATTANAAPTTVEIDGLEYSIDPTDVASGATVLGFADGEPSPTALTIPATVNHDDQSYAVTSVAAYAFDGAGLTELQFDGPIESINTQAFANNSLTSLDFLHPVGSIVDNAFGENPLTALQFHSTVDLISTAAFADLDLSAITFSDNVGTISLSAFAHNPLEAVTFVGDVDVITTGAFGAPSPSLTSPVLTFYGDVGTINNSGFSGHWVQSLLFAGDVDTIGSSAFTTDELTGLHFGGDVGTIEPGAFMASSIASVTFSGSVGTIGAGSFSSSPNLETVSFTGTVGSIDASAFGSSPVSSLTFGSTVQSIGAGAFTGHQLTELTLPGGIDDIGSGAFPGGPLETLTFNGPVTSIGAGAFTTNSLSTVDLPAGVEYIGSNAFSGNQITSVTFGPDVAEINAQAFAGNEITSVDLPASLTYLGSNAFSDNPDLTDVFVRGEAPETATTPFGTATPTVRYYWRHSVEAGVNDGYTSPQWEGYPSQAVVVVGFEDPLGNVVDSIETDQGQAVPAPDIDLGAGFGDLTGWSTDSAGESIWDFDDPVATDMTLYAQVELVDLFDDVLVGHPFFSNIQWLVNAGITTGYGDNTFRPSAAVTRQAMAAFLYRLAGEPDFDAPATASFSDVSTSHTFFTEIEWLASTGVTAGYEDGTFRPSAGVSRQAMAAFLYRLAGEPEFSSPEVASFADVPTTHPFFDEIEWLASVAITEGYDDNTFRPGSTVSRQAMAAFLSRFADL